jgi:hypothetical protein
MNRRELVVREKQRAVLIGIGLEVVSAPAATGATSANWK